MKYIDNSGASTHTLTIAQDGRSKRLRFTISNGAGKGKFLIARMPPEDVLITARAMAKWARLNIDKKGNPFKDRGI